MYFGEKNFKKFGIYLCRHRRALSGNRLLCALSDGRTLRLQNRLYRCSIKNKAGADPWGRDAKDIFERGGRHRENKGFLKCPMAASNVSAIPQVREFLLDFQRKLAEKNSVVMDGRDIGTVVIPNADIKIFLTASAEERTMRRYSEYREKGMDVDFNALLEEIKTRDYNDSHRKVAPLTKAKDAVLIDNTGFSLEQTVNKITDMVEERLK